MPRYERIAADVNVDEEAELRRLEGLPPPSTSGAAMEDALTNVGVQMHTWTNGCVYRESARPCPWDGLER